MSHPTVIPTSRDTLVESLAHSFAYILAAAADDRKMWNDKR